MKIILVVEDDATIGAFLAQAISYETLFKVVLVTDGFQALDVTREIKPSLFILDYHLPGMDGINLYDQLHTMEKLNHVPAIILSANLPEQEIAKRGIVGIEKPAELDELLRAIETVIGE